MCNVPNLKKGGGWGRGQISLYQDAWAVVLAHNTSSFYPEQAWLFCARRQGMATSSVVVRGK